jgi:hypothetical protein
MEDMFMDYSPEAAVTLAASIKEAIGEIPAIHSAREYEECRGALEEAFNLRAEIQTYNSNGLFAQALANVEMAIAVLQKYIAAYEDLDPHKFINDSLAKVKPC